MKFSEKLKQLRINKGLTQSELAKSLGMTSRTLQNYEMGSCYPRKRETVQKIADFFILAKASLFIKPSVSVVSGACTDTMSDSLNSVSKSTLS